MNTLPKHDWQPSRTLQDPSTGQRIDLESFGPSNAAVFANLRLAGQDTTPTNAPR
jgi:hypothetical protein